MEIETWKHGDMETWRHGEMETWTWRHQRKRKTEARAIFLNPFAVRSPCKWKFVVYLLAGEETNRSYPFANGLNRHAHLLYDSTRMVITQRLIIFNLLGKESKIPCDVTCPALQERILGDLRSKDSIRLH
jgi:hypothetical protein